MSDDESANERRLRLRDEQRAREAKWLEEHGWYSHYVPLGHGYVNAHTHGIAERFPGQLDFQIVVGVSSKLVSGLFWDLFRRLEAGERFSAGERVSELLRDADVLLQGAREGEREVLRLLLPAKNGALPGETDYPEDYAPLQASLDTENLPPWLED
ncbi:MAG TPA: hypothetical protein DEA08_33660 [Planctomycetes bacterium]|nr:hypothetical protein [Planctomycetota bacterium]